MTPKLYHFNDPNLPEPNYSWHFVYLHGQAEDYMNNVQEMSCWEWQAPDLFESDSPMPLAGNYVVEIYGKLAIAVIFKHRFIDTLAGRIALKDDPIALAHCRRPEDWR